MGRGRRRSRYEEENRGDMEVLIAHDPVLGLDSDDDFDFGDARSTASGGSGSRSRSRNRKTGSSSSSNNNNANSSSSKTANKKKDAAAPGVVVEGNEDGVDNEEVFYVEKIKDKRFNNARWEYLLQWQGYGPEFDTWEPIENMDCEDLLQEFEKDWEAKAKYGFDRGEVAREIIGMCIMDKKPLFMVMYKNSDDVELVPTDVANARCPNLVIEFYENRQLALLEENLEPDADAPPELEKE